jgi:hypothetical protein
MRTAPLDGGRLVIAVLVAVVGDEVGTGEHRMEAVDGPGVQRLALPGGHGHGVDGHPAIDPARVVALEEVVGQRGEDEIVSFQHVPLQAVRPHRMQVDLQDPTHQELRQRLTVKVVEQPPHGPDQRRAEDLGCAQPVENEAPSFGQVEGLGQQLAVVVDEHALVPQSLSEGVVLLLGLGRPHDIVEEEGSDVVGSEPRQLEPRSVDDGLTELAHL